MNVIDELYYVKSGTVTPKTAETAKQALDLLSEYPKPHFSASDEGELVFTYCKSNNKVDIWFIDGDIIWIKREDSKYFPGDDIKWEGKIPSKLRVDLDSLIGKNV